MELMIISEKQIMQLIQLGQLYLRQLHDLDRINPEFLSECGHYNKMHVAQLLQDIANQQSEELKVIE